MKIARLRGKLPQLAVLLVIIIAVGIRTGQTRRERVLAAAPPDKELLSCVKTVIPAIERLDNVAPEVWSAIGADNEKIGTAILAQKTTGDVIGYSGPTPLVVVVDKQEKIVGIGLLPNDDTPSYVARVGKSGFFKRWNGLTVEEAVGRDMDAVSGATYTSVAVNETVKKRLAEYAQAAAVARKANLKEVAGYLAVILVLFFALAFYFYPQRFSRYRIVLLLLSIAILGYFYGSFLSVKLIGGWLMQGISLKNQVILVTIGSLAILLPLLLGKNFYCSYVCPFGASQELAGKLCKKKLELPLTLRSILGRTRSKVLILLLIVSLFGSTVDVSNAEPFSVFLFASASKGVVVLAVIFLLLSIVIPRAWCRYFCPTGAFIDFFRKEGRDIFPKTVAVKVQLMALLFALLFLLAVLGCSL